MTTNIASETNLSRKQVTAVMESLTDQIKASIGKKGGGIFVLHGLVKIQRVHKPATKARKGINPFTKEEVTFKARPARSVLKCRPLKKLKDMV